MKSSKNMIKNIERANILILHERIKRILPRIFKKLNEIWKIMVREDAKFPLEKNGNNLNSVLFGNFFFNVKMLEF